MTILKRIRLAAPSSAILTSLVVAAVTFAIAYDNGSYGLPSRNTFAIAIWWAVIVGVALRVFNAESSTRESLALAGALAALCAWTFVSVFWAPSAEAAFNEFNRVSLFLGVFALVTIAARRDLLGRWCDGLALAASFIAFIALVSRFFPGTFSDQGLATSLRSAIDRLSFPTGYWNGLAIFVALGVPLLLRAAISNRGLFAQALAVVPIPAIVSVVFLASSRGGVVTGLVGIVAFLLLTEKRWRAGLALLCAGLGSTAAIAFLLTRNELVNGPFGTDLVERQGRDAAVLVALICLASGVIYAASRVAASRFAFEPRSWVGRAVVILLLVALVAGVVSSHPVRQFDDFRRSPLNSEPIVANAFVKTHLLNVHGSGRWQYWGSAVNEWRHHAVLGGGAGSYEAWWLQDKDIDADLYRPIKDAHSLYLESLAELGIIGLLLTAGLAIGGIALGVRGSLRSSGDTRIALAALTAVFAAYSIAAGIDWMWELTAVTIFALVALALVNIDTVNSAHPLQVVEANEPRRPRSRRIGLGVVGLAGAWLLICAQGIPLLAQLRIKDSQAYVNRGKTANAVRAAMDARNLQPWASSPYLQLALVSEQEGLIRDAAAWNDKAIKRDSNNWQLWYVASRLETKLGNAREAQRALNHSVALNPRSYLFSGIRRETLSNK